MKVIKVSVIMPVYNGEEYLEEAINSILSQTFKDFEFIIIDDGSSDGSRNIILSYSDKRIRLITHRKNLGLAKTLNEGLLMACGGYIARMDCDDMATPNRLETQFNFMEKNPDVVVCGSWAKAINKEQEIIFNMKSPTGILLKYNFWKPSPFIHPSVIIRKSKLSGLKYDYVRTEDYEFWLHLKHEGKKFDNISEYLLNYRIHKNSLSMRYSEDVLRSSHETFKKYSDMSSLSLRDYKSLCSLDFTIGFFARLKLLLLLGKKIDYPAWFALLDNSIYILKKYLFKTSRN